MEESFNESAPVFVCFVHTRKETHEHVGDAVYISEQMNTQHAVCAEIVVLFYTRCDTSS